MKMVKSLILSSAAGLVAMSGAQAADLPVKAKPVEYVKVCSLYGAGFWYIPGTDTCIRIGGAIRIDTVFNGGQYDAPFWQGGGGGGGLRSQNYYNTRARANSTLDTRTATEYGVLRTYSNIQFDWSAGRENIAGGFVEVDYAFLQFVGFTFGKAVSQFDAPWVLAKPSISSGFFSGSNNQTGINQIAYTATFGNGVSGTISLEDAAAYRNAGIYNTSGIILAPGATPFLTTTYGAAPNGANNTFLGNAQGGTHVPDVVGNLRLDQAWGTLHFGAALHNVNATYYNPGNQNSGHPSDAWGGAGTVALELKQLPTGVGDSFKIESTYANGAAKYVFGGTIDTLGGGRFAKIGGTSLPGAFQSLAFGYILDGLYPNIPGAGITKSNAWEVDAWFEHYWSPQWRTSVFASYSHIGYGSAGNALLAQAFGPGGRLGTAGVAVPGASIAGGVTTANLFLNPGSSFDFNIIQAGTKTSWQPVKDLTLSAEFIYSRLDQNLSGTYVNVPGAGLGGGKPPGATYELRSQNLYNGSVQILRSF